MRTTNFTYYEAMALLLDGEPAVIDCEGIVWFRTQVGDLDLFVKRAPFSLYPSKFLKPDEQIKQLERVFTLERLVRMAAEGASEPNGLQTHTVPGAKPGSDLSEKIL